RCVDVGASYGKRGVDDGGPEAATGPIWGFSRREESDRRGATTRRAGRSLDVGLPHRRSGRAPGLSVPSTAAFRAARLRDPLDRVRLVISETFLAFLEATSRSMLRLFVGRRGVIDVKDRAQYGGDAVARGDSAHG